MADDANKLTPPHVEVVPSIQGTISAIGSANAPFIYFDVASSFGIRDGVANITLEAARHMINADGMAVFDRVVTAHIRMGVGAVRSLKAALDGIELLAKGAPEGPKN